VVLPGIQGIGWKKNGWRPLNMWACILNTELLLFCMFWPITFSFWIWHYLWDSLSINYCTDIMYLYLTCSVSYGVNLYWDLWNVNKFKFNSNSKLIYYSKYSVILSTFSLSHEVRKIIGCLENVAAQANYFTAFFVIVKGHFTAYYKHKDVAKFFIFLLSVYIMESHVNLCIMLVGQNITEFENFCLSYWSYLPVWFMYY
jgi:hypothetical protein